MKSSPVLAALVATGAALALTACSSSSSAGSGSVVTPAKSSAAGSSAAAGAGSTAAGTGASTSSAKDAASGKSINVCAALPLATAAKITGVAFATAKSSSVGGQLFNCEYSGGTNLLQIAVSPQYGKDLISSDISALKQVGHAPTMISGVGDEAFSEPDPKGNAGSVGASAFASYGAVFGDSYIKIGGLYVDPAQGKQIVELIHAKM